VVEAALGGHVGGERLQVLLGEELAGEKAGTDGGPVAALPRAAAAAAATTAAGRGRVGVRGAAAAAGAGRIGSGQGGHFDVPPRCGFLTKNQLSNVPAGAPSPEVQGLRPPGGRRHSANGPPIGSRANGLPSRIGTRPPTFSPSTGRQQWSSRKPVRTVM